jgi:predicted negative regulator of RcsB-dependent stress response
MALDLEQQEQIDEIKAWWARWGKLLSSLVIVAAVAYAGYVGWHYYRDSQARQASVLYLALQEAMQKNDVPRVAQIAASVVEQHPSTGYAVLAALIGARVGFQTGDFKSARSQLEWVIANARDDEIRDIARLRLAAILIDEREYTAAQRVLDTRHGGAFDGLFLDLRGDLLVAQGRTADARTAYQQALERLDAHSPYRGLVQLKLDALGDAQ